MKINFNDQQTKAINHGKGPAIILAVPGSGKTTVLLHRTYNLISKHKILPEKILSITFSRASAKEMKKRFVNNFKNTSSIPITFSTIHSFSYSILREYTNRHGIPYTLIEGNSNSINKITILRNLYYDINGEWAADEKLEGINNGIGYIKNMMIGVDDYLKENKVEINHFKEIYMSYENFKKEKKMIDFDDMLVLTLDFLKRDSYLLSKWRNKYDFIQVDEGQDTSKIQLEIIKLIAKPKNNLFIVADDDQSIYGFRGAFPQGLFDLKREFKDLSIFYMEENYRSSRNIVSVCNKFIRQNKLRYNKNIFTKNNYVSPINIVKLNTITEQYEYIIKELKKFADYSNAAILYRNNISSIGVIEYLENNKIPFHMRDVNVKFFNHWIIKDIISFLNVANNPEDLNSFEKIYFKMKGFIYKNYVDYIKTLNYDKSVFDRILEINDLSRDYRQKIMEIKIDFNRLKNMAPHEAITFIEKSLEYEIYLKENALKFGYTFDSLKTILYYLKLISAKTENLEELLRRLKYLEYLTFQSKYNTKGVNLSTIHSAKGLEYDRVFMIDLIEGDFPSSNSIDAFENGKIQLMEEERRLFYVGMTRTKNNLMLLTYSNKSEKKVYPSRFVNELENL